MGRTQLDCSVTLANVKTWTIDKVDPLTGAVTQTIDATSIETSTNAEIFVAARFLDFGHYKFTLTVKMNSVRLKEEFASSLSTYVQIVTSPLIGQMTSGGMTMKSVGHGIPVTLSPGKHSRDPDLNPKLDQVPELHHSL